MNDAVIKVIYVCFILNLIVCLAAATTSAATTTTTPQTGDDDSSKNLTVRSINDVDTANDAPLRINLAGEYAMCLQPTGIENQWLKQNRFLLFMKFYITMIFAYINCEQAKCQTDEEGEAKQQNLVCFWFNVT